MRASLLQGAALVAGALVLLGVSKPRRHKQQQQQQAQSQSQQQAADALGDLRHEIEARSAVMTEAFHRGDLAAIARVYDDDAQIRGPQLRVKGRWAVDQYWTGLQGAKDWKLEAQEVGGSHDSAWEIGRSTLTRVVGNGPPRESVVDFVLIWKRDATGQLRVHMDIYNFAY